MVNEDSDDVLWISFKILTKKMKIAVCWKNCFVSLLQVEHDTAKSMQTLLKLDAIKSRMTSAAEALKVSEYRKQRQLINLEVP